METQGSSASDRGAVSFEIVFRRELNAVVGGRAEPPDDGRDAPAFDRARRLQLVGLALSGGGIRSATYCLGVLQSLAKLRHLNRINFGYAIVGERKGPNETEELLYYRIQSHLRKMGLGRRGLAALLDDGERNLVSREGPPYQAVDDRVTADAGRQRHQMLLSVRRELRERSRSAHEAGA